MRRRRANQKKEKFIMLASSLFVLSALTLTGIYVKERSKISNENSIDLTELEHAAADKADEIAKNSDTDNLAAEANASRALNPAKAAADTGVADRYQYSGVPIISASKEAIDEAAIRLDQERENQKQQPVVEKSLHFSDEGQLTWPIVGNVIINYSMDKTVYFATLNQYHYSPGMVIEATEGERISAAAEGQVTNVYHDAKLGNCISIDLGDGYELTYGQLKDISLKQGDYVKTGDFVGNVSAPTKYYSVEGANVYFALTKNGEPINPLNRLS